MLFFLAACSGKVPNSSSKNTIPAPPAWLAAKPVQEGYFVGIGHSIKDGQNNFIQQAKKSALEDLVSEIRVNVSSTSTLSQIDANREFQERYEQIIKTTAADEIEEFEQVDVWQDERNYWVYYRLSKQRYRDIKEEQKRNAVARSLDFFTKARQLEKDESLAQALAFYFQGFTAIEKYLAEPVRIAYEGKEILLTTEIISSLQQLLNQLEVKVEPAAIALNRRVGQENVSWRATVVNKATRKPVADIPLRAAFEKGEGDIFPDYKTDVRGEATILLTKISAKDLEQRIGVSVNPAALAATSSVITGLLVQQLVVPRASVLLNVQRPIVYLSTVEQSFNENRANPQLSNRLKNFLTNAGFEFTDDQQKAELWIDLNANAEKGAVSGSIFVTYVTAVIRVTAAKNRKEIYATTLDRIKGYSLDYNRSSQEAYNKSLEILEKEKLPELLNVILQ